jgi:hypothetical protein
MKNLKQIQDSIVRHLCDSLQDAVDSNLIPDKTFGLVSDCLDYVEAKYFGTTPDGDRQIEYSESEPKRIDFEQAIYLMASRVESFLREEQE